MTKVTLTGKDIHQLELGLRAYLTSEKEFAPRYATAESGPRIQNAEALLAKLVALDIRYPNKFSVQVA